MKIFCRVIFFIALYLPFSGIVETFGRDNSLVPPQNKEILRVLSDSLSGHFWQRYTDSRDLAEKMNLEVDFKTDEGVRFSLQHIENGIPYYYQTFNRGGAITSGASQLYPGGRQRIYLTGKDMQLGVWDAGQILHTHPEFSGRVVNVNQDRAFDDHATHVAGTIAAKGIRESARGMAYDASIRGFHWNNDLGEMAREAAAGQILSNHSYGLALGWEFRNGNWQWMGDPAADEDYRFGFYSNYSRSLDQIAFNAPHYLIVWAAGNDRNDMGDGSKPPDGPYGCIGPEGVAKNVLTIGAVAGIPSGYQQPADVVMTNFSSWGPTDDGRVKPDLVAKGQSVFSTGLDNDYSTKSGTSMAAPTAAGSLLLVQQFYRDMYGGKFMKAASLKGLAIHTANRAGLSHGPDYSYGWGLLNVNNMIDFLIHRHDTTLYFTEATLVDQASYVYEFHADGSGPIVASLSWTDRAGTPVAPQLNPSDLMLVNDLDMRIIHEDGDTLFPWILNPEFPMALPNKGDNFRDNVEKIFLEQAPAGKYQLVITHKDSLAGGRQDFSLFVQNGHLPRKKEIYWIGESGIWSDSTAWSYSSGGPSAGIIPGEDHHVVFDRHSFSDETQVVALAETASSHSLSFGSLSKGKINLDGHSLQIASTLHADKNFVAEGSEGTLLFSGRLKNNYLFINDTQPEMVSRLEFVFDSSQAVWNLLTGFRADRLVLRQGRLIMHDVDVNIRELLVTSALPVREIDAGASVFSGLQRVIFPQLRFVLKGQEATMVFEYGNTQDDDPMLFRSSATSLYKLVNKGELVIDGTLGLEYLENHGPLHLKSDLNTGYAFFSDSAGFFLYDNVSLNLGDGFSGSGKPGQLVPLSGTGINTSVSGISNRIYCLDYVRVENLPVSGPGIFNAGENSQLVNSDGWLAMDCDHVVIADFSVRSACEHSWTFFTDQSRGKVDNWFWRFGSLGTSTEQNPVFTFPNRGGYRIGLTAGSPTFSNTVERSIFVISNPIPETQIHIEGNTYYVDRAGYTYQWYRDQQPIPGATKASYNNTDNLGGVYTVLLSNDLCNRPAINEVVVSANQTIADDHAILRIYPNPASSYIHIDAGQKDIDEVKIFDLHGRVVFRIISPGNSYHADLTSLLSGNYMVQVQVGKQLYNSKIQVMR